MMGMGMGVGMMGGAAGMTTPVGENPVQAAAAPAPVAPEVPVAPAPEVPPAQPVV